MSKRIKEGITPISRKIGNPRKNTIAEADKVWVRVTYTVTHTGEYRGLAPTGKKITLTSIQIWRIVDDKVAERGRL